jgi:hypothetical protein
MSWIVGDDNGIVIADLMECENDLNNVHLIAAAPDLLEMLKDYVAQHACGCTHPACKRCATELEARQLIAKAEGNA